jgi:lipopolysaccharide export LptBFGC system permease protein LptF
MKQAYRYLAYTVAVGVALQAAWIALGTFQLAKYVDDGHTVTKDWNGNLGLNLHGIFAIIVALAAIALFAVSFGARLPEGQKWAGFVLLAVVVQWVLAFISFGVPAIGILHGLNAFVVMGLAGTAATRAGRAAPASAARPNPVAM